MMRAALAGHREVVELLIAEGTDVNARQSNGATALLWRLRKASARS